MATHPRECALALAIPLTREDFLAGLHAGPEKDFAKSLERSRRGAKNSFLWNDLYAPVAETALEVAGAVATNGVTVIPEATLCDLRALFERFRVITLVAHWRAAQFHAGDFLAPRSLISRLRDPLDPIGQALFDILFDGQTTCMENAPPEDLHALTRTLTRIFNNVLRQGCLYEKPRANARREIAEYDETYHMYLNRKVIDAAFADVIAPGNRIEFYDQFRSVDAVNAAIPDTFEGVLDFTVCNSVLIGNQIKKQRHCLVVVNEKPASITYRLLIYKGIIELLQNAEMEYIEAVAAIRHGLANSKR